MIRRRRADKRLPLPCYNRSMRRWSGLSPAKGGLVFRLVLVAMLIISAVVSSLPASNYAAADDGSVEEAQKKVENAVGQQLEGIDFSGLETILGGIDSNSKGFFGTGGFGAKVRSILSGDFAQGYDNIFAALLAVVFSELVGAVPYLAAIVAVAVLYSMLGSMSVRADGANTVFFACFGAVILIASTAVLGLVSLTKSTVGSMQAQMNITFPIMLAALTALGGSASAAVYQPMVSVLSYAVSNILTGVILPLFVFGFVFNVAGNLSTQVKLKKFTEFTGSLAKWIIGIVFTVFSAFMTIQGVTAASFDGVSVKTARYAISHYVPIIGGYLSEGFNLVLAGSVLIKNAVGLGALLLMFATVIAPLMKVIVMMLALKLTAAVCEPIEERFSDFVAAAAKGLNMLIAVMLGVAFMYFISVLLVISTGNLLI